MQIGLYGYGKMGMAVERIAQERGHEVRVLKYHGRGESTGDLQVAIDFTHAGIAPSIVRHCIDQGIPVVSGTTGWNAGMSEIHEYCLEMKGAFLWAPNFSVGMHVTFAVNRFLAALMEHLEDYDVTITETHHTAKKDAPSGTAIALADQIVEKLTRKTHWQLQEAGREFSGESLEVTARRESEVRGIHEVMYKSPHDVISIRHEAVSRDGFALGAVLAAEWLKNRKGVYHFSDVLADLIGLK